MTAIPPPFKHQEHTTRFILENPRCHVWNDPGTGKTRSILDAFAEHRKGGGGKGLVFAPRTILEPAWVRDANQFTPGLDVVAAYAKNRREAFLSEADLIVTNHDAVKWVLDNPWSLDGIDFIAVDESTAYKNRTSDRSKAAAKVVAKCEPKFVIMSTGTPIPNSVLDIWHQAFLVDGGERLGSRFFAFRAAVCEPIQTGPQAQMVKWADKEGAVDVVADLLSDITIRYRREDCLDLPKNQVIEVPFTLAPKARKAYETMVRDALLQLEKGEIQAVNAATAVQKLLQIASGAVYENEDTYHLIDDSRYKLVAELVGQRKHSVVAFLWKHQKDLLAKEFDRAKISYAVIDGSTRDPMQIVEGYQAGLYQTVLIHPQSGAHGLTLTRGTATIWPSPTYNAEHFQQFNYRIDRAGQTQETETLLVQGQHTVEEQVYQKLNTKLGRQLDMLQLMQALGAQASEAA